MSKIKNTFQQGTAFIGFLTAGDITPQKTIDYILDMEKAGASLIEIGIPFSDPVAEGPVIQAANIRALQQGMSVNGVFEIVKEVRKYTQIPLVFLTYLNPVFFYGYERFFQKCQELGIDGIIIPDLPYEEKQEVHSVCQKYNVDLITLIAPTSKERIQMLAKEAEGFIYLVSSLGVTGTRQNITTDIQSTIAQIHAVTNTPIAVGFGIHTPEQFRDIAEYADGVIVGSAIVKIIAQYGENAHKALYEYVKSMIN